MTTHELAKVLLKEKDVPVVVSRDSEGNSYGTINENSIGLISKENKEFLGLSKDMFIIYPYVEGLELDSIYI